MLIQANNRPGAASSVDGAGQLDDDQTAIKTWCQRSSAPRRRRARDAATCPSQASIIRQPAAHARRSTSSATLNTPRIKLNRELVTRLGAFVAQMATPTSGGHQSRGAGSPVHEASQLHACEQARVDAASTCTDHQASSSYSSSDDIDTAVEDQDPREADNDEGARDGVELKLKTPASKQQTSAMNTLAKTSSRIILADQTRDQSKKEAQGESGRHTNHLRHKANNSINFNQQPRRKQQQPDQTRIAHNKRINNRQPTINNIPAANEPSINTRHSRPGNSQAKKPPPPSNTIEHHLKAPLTKSPARPKSISAETGEPLEPSAESFVDSLISSKKRTSKRSCRNQAVDRQCDRTTNNDHDLYCYSQTRIANKTNCKMLLRRGQVAQLATAKSPLRRYLLFSSLFLLVFLFCASLTRVSRVQLASGMILRPADESQAIASLQAPSSSVAGEQADLNAAILATMTNQSKSGSSFKSNQLEYTNNNNQEPSSGQDLAGQETDNNSTTSRNVVDSSSSNQNLATSLTNNKFLQSVLTIGRVFIMGAIIIGDICGNSLVILSVCRHSKLRVTTNWFVVSLACADILVALFAMTFNASVIISGKWLFKPWVCDFWNSCDVLASTASILHLCCISIDRYIAITRPLDYPTKITTKRVRYALALVWLSSALLSYLPIFTGIYTTSEHLEWQKDNPDKCEFVVNRVYAIVSSSISFWIPCCIMVFTYYRIYMEASRQEKLIHQAQSIMPAPMLNHAHHAQSNQQQQQPGHLGSGASAGSKHSSDSQQAAAAQRAKQRRSKSMALAPSSAEMGASSQNARIRQLAVAQQLQQFESTTTISSNQQQQQQHSTTTTTFSQQAATGGDCAEKQPLNQQEPASDKDQSNNNNNNSSTQSGDTNTANSKQQKLNIGRNSNQQQVTISSKDNFDLKCGNTNKNKTKFNNHYADQDEDYDDFDPRDPNSGQSTPTKRSISKMKREHKAAKTLGIIMGVFILCWLPFFSWYTPTQICGHACDGIVPHEIVTILFWIGYFNSTLNPIIYAYFNSEFRDAFKKTLQWIFCCCEDLKCLRVNRGNDNQHYNCTYRSTQEIVLVSNG